MDGEQSGTPHQDPMHGDNSPPPPGQEGASGDAPDFGAIEMPPAARGKMDTDPQASREAPAEDDQDLATGTSLPQAEAHPLVSPPSDAGHQVEVKRENEVSQPPQRKASETEGEKKPKREVPRHYDIDEVVVAEMIERRNMDTLKDLYGGVDGLTYILQSDTVKGIDSATVGKRIEQFGENVLDRGEPVTFWEMLVDAFSDRIIQILVVAAIVSIVFGVTLPNPYSGHKEPETGWIEGTAIIISVLVVTFTGAINNYQKAKKFEEMEKEQSVKDISVFRDGREVTIKSNELVVGDVMLGETGMEMCCDGVYISGNNLKTNESPITGEPDLIEKSVQEDAFIISGTSLEEGDGKFLVIAVGMQSFQGQMKEALQEESAETPLQEHLTELGDNIGKIGLGVALILFIGLCIKEVILISTKDKKASATSFLNFIIICVTLIAVAIPEGLPLAVTISLAFSMKAMMNDMCMVRVLASCETMGAATAICSDKTGTLTTNQMTVVQGVICDEEYLIDGYGLHPRKDMAVVVCKRDNMQLNLPPSLIDQFCFAIGINSTAREQTNEEGQHVWVGNKTEIGILGLIKRLHRSYEDARESVATSDKAQYPFSSEKKRMTTLVRSNGVITSYIKGASEAILASCDRWMDSTGNIQELSDPKRVSIELTIRSMADQGNRTIGVACAETTLSDFPHDEPNMQFVFIGLLGIQDPMREEVPKAVDRCHTARLRVRMVTGDNINTALAIAKKCNIYHDGDESLTGQQFRDMYINERERLIELLPRLRVLARSSPHDKHILVGLLQEEHGEVVGVTGDGTNDAPALKLANVGFAMNTGTDIAKGAADMVLLDDNFATVVTAIKWGRAVNDNIKKFLQYQLAINMSGVLLSMIGALASATSKEPIAPVQLLWLNLIMDTLAALSLATELPEEQCLLRMPVFKQANLITRKMFAFILGHGTYQLILILLILFLGHTWFETIDDKSKCGAIDYNNLTDDTRIIAEACKKTCTDSGGIWHSPVCQQGRVHSTIIFNTFIWFQIFNAVNARKIYGEINCFEGVFTRSRVMILVFFIIIVLQVVAVEFGGAFLSTTSLEWHYWLICIGFGTSELFVGLLIRGLPVNDWIPEKARQEEEARVLREREHGRLHVNEQQRLGSTMRPDPSLRRKSTFLRKSTQNFVTPQTH